LDHPVGGAPRDCPEIFLNLALGQDRLPAETFRLIEGSETSSGTAAPSTTSKFRKLAKFDDWAATASLCYQPLGSWYARVGASRSGSARQTPNLHLARCSMNSSNRRRGGQTYRGRRPMAAARTRRFRPGPGARGFQDGTS
jgi:hypothetical protein